MKAKSYIQMNEDCFFKLEKQFKIVCCECQLVHSWEFERTLTGFGFRIKVDKRATAQMRRKSKK